MTESDITVWTIHESTGVVQTYSSKDGIASDEIHVLTIDGGYVFFGEITARDNLSEHDTSYLLLHIYGLLKVLKRRPKAFEAVVTDSNGFGTHLKKFFIEVVSELASRKRVQSFARKVNLANSVHDIFPSICSVKDINGNIYCEVDMLDKVKSKIPLPDRPISRPSVRKYHRILLSRMAVLTCGLFRDKVYSSYVDIHQLISGFICDLLRDIGLVSLNPSHPSLDSLEFKGIGPTPFLLV